MTHLYMDTDEYCIMGDIIPGRTITETDGGITDSVDMKAPEQCVVVISKRNQIIELFFNIE